MTTFREAIEAKDMDAVEAMLADDVVFTSPVAFKPYPGRAITAAILRAVVKVFEDFTYARRDPRRRPPRLRVHRQGRRARAQRLRLPHLRRRGPDHRLQGDGPSAACRRSLAARMGEQFEEIKAAAVRG